MNETFNYLRANGIYSLEDLERRVSEHSVATESLKPVYDDLQKIKFEKPRAKYKARCV